MKKIKQSKVMKQFVAPAVQQVSESKPVSFLSSHFTRNNFTYILRLQFLEKIKNRVLRFVLRGVILIELLFILFYFLNSFFAGFTDPIEFHVNIWKVFTNDITLNTTITWAVPVGLAAVGATFNERVGVINIGIEGIMIWSAWATIYFTYIFQEPWMGVLFGVLIGITVGFIHALFTITFKAEQIVIGVAINLLALGLTIVFTKIIWGTSTSPTVANPGKFQLSNIPILKNLQQENLIVLGIPREVFEYIPNLINAFDGQSPLIYIGILIFLLAHILLYKTKFGLRFRVIGEHPQTAATAGINVKLYQYFAVILSGALAGLGGAMISLNVGLFRENLIRGEGFIALVAMIFGNWTVLGSVFAAVFFGFFLTLRIILLTDKTFSKELPAPIVQMIPYVVALVAVAGLIGRARAPKNIGKPYDPTEE